MMQTDQLDESSLYIVRSYVICSYNQPATINCINSSVNLVRDMYVHMYFYVILFVYGMLILCPHKCGLCTHHMYKLSRTWILLCYNPLRTTFLLKEPAAEISGYGPGIKFLLMHENP